MGYPRDLPLAIHCLLRSIFLTKNVTNCAGSVSYTHLTYRHQKVDLPDYNMVKANEFKTDYPGVAVKNLFPLVAEEVRAFFHFPDSMQRRELFI